MALKIRNCLLFVIVLVLLYGTLGCKLADKAGLPLPDALAKEDTHSYLEGRDYTDFPDVNAETVSSGRFQDDFEQYVADMVPFRDELLLGNAALQRQGISTSAAVCGYDVYPTFLDSGYLYSASQGRLYAVPATQSEDEADAYHRFADKVNELAAEHGDKRFFLCRPSRSDDLNRGSLEGLVSKPVDATYLDEECLSRLSERITVVNQGVDTLERFDELYYRTDHHWTIDGGYDCYANVATAMGHGDSLTQKKSSIVYEEPPFYGSESRGGLMVDLESDLIRDYVFDLPDYTVSFDGGKKGSSQRLVHSDAYESGTWSESLYTNRYAEYFHGDPGLITIETKQAKSGTSLLIVGDSMTNCIERLFVNHYDTVYVYDPRHASESLEDFLADHEDVDDVLLLLSRQTMVAGLN